MPRKAYSSSERHRVKPWQIVAGVLIVLLVAAPLFLPRGYLTGMWPVAIGQNPPTSRIHVPSGFRVSVFATEVDGARSLALGPDGLVFVGTRDEGKVYALVDRNHDGRSDEVVVIADGLESPNGVAFHDGDLYVAEIHRVIRFASIADTFRRSPSPEVVRDDFPDDAMHGWKFIAFGPDDKLYIPIGVPCNICMREDARYGSIVRMNADGSELEIFARGIRNTVGFDWRPGTNELWFTENGRDRMGDDRPRDELNRAERADMHFGFPFCHEGSIDDPDFAHGRACSEFTSPVLNLSPHAAALGMRFYTGTQFPDRYRGGIFLAEHGSWNREEPIGYRIVFVPMNGARAGRWEVFASGWLSDTAAAWGRPVDVLVMPDGALLVSDDKADAVFRIGFSS